MDLKIEFEIGDDGAELEIELTWGAYRGSDWASGGPTTLIP